jgi:hypothetical protein
MKELRYPDVERVLARMHDIEPNGLKTFRARLRHFRNLDLPQGIRIGRGRRPTYGWAEILQMVLALELAEFDMAPASIVRSVHMGWTRWQEWYVKAEANRGEQFFVLISPSLMLEGRGGMQTSGMMMLLRSSDLQSMITKISRIEERRHVLLNFTATLSCLRESLEQEVGEIG